MVAALNLDGPGHAPPYLCVSQILMAHKSLILFLGSACVSMGALFILTEMLMPNGYNGMHHYWGWGSVEIPMPLISVALVIIGLYCTAYSLNGYRPWHRFSK